MSPAFKVLAILTACRNVGLLRQYTVAIQEAIASANRWVPLDKLLDIMLESPASYVFSKLDKLGKMKSSAVLGQNRKRNAMRVRAVELTANHIYWKISHRDGGNLPDPVVAFCSGC